MKPFLKWAGNKHRVLKHILPELPIGNRLIEPFAGSGAVFMNTTYKSYLLADINADLINLYKTLQQEGQKFINYSKTYFVPEYNKESAFYHLRKTFNSTKDVRLKAALFVYLNRHCFNGLCRYNSKGEFNVPFGRYKSPHFPEEEMIAFHKKSQIATFLAADFRAIMEIASPGDVVYCDPPYVPLSITSNFTSYASGGFGTSEQLALAAIAIKLSELGVVVIISNHDTEFTREAYKSARIISFDVQRFIAADGENRKKASELLAIFSKN